MISRSGEDDAPPTAAENLAANQAEPNEPLAELGVAPGTTEEDIADEAAEEREANNLIGPRP